MAGHAIEPGLGELTLGELYDREATLRRNGQSADAQRAAHARRLRFYFPLTGVLLAAAATGASAIVACLRAPKP
jgi:hypothetical protein